MSILFVLLMFLLVMSISYFHTRSEVATQSAVRMAAQAPRMQREYGFSIPEGYCFHPGHTWVLREGGENARVGVESFATNLIGKLDHIEVAGVNRWVRQGQKLVTLKGGGATFELVSPVEGVVTAVNKDAIEDPSVIGRDRIRKGGSRL
jgi:glycine cleavage system H protein